MKKSVFTFLFFCCTTLFAQYRVPLHEGSTGSKYVVGYINGIEVVFTFDTGCSSLAINANIFNKLVQNGSVNRADLSQPIPSIMANGYMHNVRTFPIKELKLGDYTFYDVVANVGTDDEKNAPPLLGQSVLMLMESYTIKGDYIEFTPKPRAEQKALCIAERYDQDKSKAQGIVDLLTPLYKHNKLSYKFLYTYALALSDAKQYRQAIECYEKVVAKTSYDAPELLIYNLNFAKMELANELYEAQKYTEALEAYEVLAEAFKKDKSLASLYEYVIYSICYTYLQMDDFEKARIYGNEYINMKLKPFGITMASLQKTSVKAEPQVGELLKTYSQFYDAQNDTKNAEKYKRMAINAGYKAK